MSQPSLNSIVQVDSVTGDTTTLASDLNVPVGIALGCIPRPSVLLPYWESAGNSFADAMVSSIQTILSIVTPSYKAKLTTIVTAQEDAEVSCPAMLLPLQSFVALETIWAADTIAEVTKCTLTEVSGGQGMFDGVASSDAAYMKAVGTMVDDVLSTNVSAGYGAGFGFSIQCNSSVLFVFGVGFGGGLSVIR